MTRTNAAISSSFSKKMWDKYNTRNETLKTIDELGLSSTEIGEKLTQDIIDTFYKDFEDLKRKPGFKEARETHSKVVQAKIELMNSLKRKEILEKEYLDKLEQAKSEDEKAKLEIEYEEKLEQAQNDVDNSKIKHRKAEGQHNTGEEFLTPEEKLLNAIFGK